MADTVKPAPKDRPAPLHPDSTRITISASTLDRVVTLLGFAYEATWTSADAGAPADWSTQGEPVAEALELVRAALR